jgi:hypothetical protein
LIEADADTKPEQFLQVTLQFQVTSHVSFTESQKTIGYDVLCGRWCLEPQGHTTRTGRMSVAYPVTIPKLKGEIGLRLRLMHHRGNLLEGALHVPTSFLIKPS